MKRTLIFFLCFLFALCLMGCTPTDVVDTTASDPAATLYVGFGRSDITPLFPVPLGGYYGTQYSTEVKDPLYASCIAFSDSEDSTVLLFHVDLVNSGGTVIPFARKAISKKTGIPVDNIIVAATHTHSGPQMDSSDPIMEDYYDFLEDQMVKAAEAALADRREAEMYTAATNLKNLNFVRHYVMNDGSVVGDNFGNASGKTYVDHVQPVDDQMQLIRFKRDGGKDILLVNWQVHPLRSSSSTTSHISADVVGSMRTTLEPQLDCYMAYFSGASGNVSPSSRITSENVTSDYWEQGEAMTQGAILACDNMTRQKTGKVQILRQTMDAAANDNTIPFNTFAFSVGDVAFVSAPYEMFDTNGKFIKDNSPFEMTFVATNSNGSYHYVPAQWAYEYGYPCYEMTSGGYNKGVGEELANNYVAMLNSLYPTRGCAGLGSTGTKTEAKLYLNLDLGAELTADANGVYTVSMMQENQILQLKVADKALLDQFIGAPFVGLQLSGDQITDVIHMWDMPYQRLAQNYYVQSVGGNTVKLNALASYAGNELLVKLPEGMPIYDVIPNSPSYGGTTKLQKNDCISLIADADGTPKLMYVLSRPAVEREGLMYCQHCKKEVSWYDWLSSAALPTSDGHYILAGDVNVAKTSTIGSGSICLDINGKTITQTSFGSRIYALQGTGTLSIMDSVGNGTFIPASTDRSQLENVGMIIYVNKNESTLNLYGGILDASKCTSLYGSAVSQRYGTFNMYGGTILGGIAYGPGSTAVSANGVFNMYGGRIVGGESIGTTYTSPVGGAAVRVLGVATIYDGIIEGGNHVVEGGVIRVCPDVEGCVGKLVLKGGTITGGNAPIGGGIVCPALSTVIISGNVKIAGNTNGNLYLYKGAIVTIGEEGLGEDAQIGITMEEPGTFVTGVPDGVDISKYFTSDDASKKIVKNSDGSWSVK